MKARFLALPPNTQGALWVLASAVLFTGMMTLAKGLGDRYDAYQIVFFRALAGLVFVLPFLLRQGGGSFVTGQPLLQLVRCGTAAGAMMCGFYAIVNLPLADATALTFSRPLFLVVLAVLILRETVGGRRLGATVAGFIGVLIMMRPTGQMDDAAAIAVLGAFLVACSAVAVKILSRTDSNATLLFYAGVATTLATAVPALTVWVPPTLEDYVILAAMGGFGVAAHSCFIRGYSVGEASAVTPMDYTRLIFAGLAGFVFFGAVPDGWTLAGAGLIAAATFYIARREAMAAR